MSQKLVVVLVGPQGAGKTTWCAQHTADFVRISQDEQGPVEHYRIFEQAVVRGEPRIVVDRINAPKHQRKRYLSFARQHGYRTRIVWFNVDRAECVRRCKQRGPHPTLEPQNCDAAISMYFRNLQFPTRAEADDFEIVGNPPDYAPVVDLSTIIGERRFLIVGDVHGCCDELVDLLGQLRFDADADVLISVGDIVDRGPKVRECLELVRSLPRFHMVLGNHEEKLIRYLRGNPVKVAQGLQTTIDSFGGRFPDDLLDWLEALPLIFRTPAGYVVHAGFNPESPPEEQSREDCIYMRYFGGRTYLDEISGVLWHTLWPKDAPTVFFGHIPTEHESEAANVYTLDGGCVRGGELRIFDSRDGVVHRLKAFRAYVVKEAARQPEIVSGRDQVSKREEYVAQGLLRTDRTDDGTLAIYTYTDACVYANAWDDITRNSRGHIFDFRSGECVAWAFPKFFNLGENPETLPEQFPWDGPFEIAEKLDGWLGVLYRHGGVHKIATRGSFHSAGSIWATAEIQNFDLAAIPDEATICFEILTPEQRIILNYGDRRRLVMLGAFNRHTGAEFPRSTLEQWSQSTGLPLVELQPPMSLLQLKARQKEMEKFEGFVLRFPDGRRVKIKTDWYLELARLMARLSPISIWESLQDGVVQTERFAKIPEELRDLADSYRSAMEGQYAEALRRIETIVRPLIQQLGSDRAALGRHVQQHRKELGAAAGAVFLVLDGKHDRLAGLVKDLIYPRGNKYVDLDRMLPV